MIKKGGRVLQKLLNSRGVVRNFSYKSERGFEQPKWMKFFEKGQTPNLNFDRSHLILKGNSSLLEKVVMDNIDKLNLKQIGQCLKIEKMNERTKVYKELIEQICDLGLETKIEKEILILIIQNGSNLVITHKPITAFIVNQISKIDEELTFEDLFTIIGFMVNSNIVNSKFVEDFVEALKVEKNIECLNSKKQFDLHECIFVLSVVRERYEKKMEFDFDEVIWSLVTNLCQEIEVCSFKNMMLNESRPHYYFFFNSMYLNLKANERRQMRVSLSNLIDKLYIDGCIDPEILRKNITFIKWIVKQFSTEHRIQELRNSICRLLGLIMDEYNAISPEMMRTLQLVNIDNLGLQVKRMESFVLSFRLDQKDIPKMVVISQAYTDLTPSFTILQELRYDRYINNMACSNEDQISKFKQIVQTMKKIYRTSNFAQSFQNTIRLIYDDVALYKQQSAQKQDKYSGEGEAEALYRKDLIKKELCSQHNLYNTHYEQDQFLKQVIGFLSDLDRSLGSKLNNVYDFKVQMDIESEVSKMSDLDFEEDELEDEIVETLEELNMDIFEGDLDQNQKNVNKSKTDNEILLKKFSQPSELGFFEKLDIIENYNINAISSNPNYEVLFSTGIVYDSKAAFLHEKIQLYVSTLKYLILDRTVKENEALLFCQTINSQLFEQYISDYGALKTVLEDLMTIYRLRPKIFEGSVQLKRIADMCEKVDDFFERELVPKINNPEQLLEYYTKITQDIDNYFPLESQKNSNDIKYYNYDTTAENRSEFNVINMHDLGKLFTETTKKKNNKPNSKKEIIVREPIPFKLEYNLLRNTSIGNDIFNQSSIKSYLSQYLKDSSYNFNENVLAYPFLTDFLVDNSETETTIAINIITDSHLIKNTVGVLTKINESKVLWQKKQGYTVLNLDARIFIMNYDSFDIKMKKLLNSAKNPEQKFKNIYVQQQLD